MKIVIAQSNFHMLKHSIADASALRQLIEESGGSYEGIKDQQMLFLVNENVARELNLVIVG